MSEKFYEGFPIEQVNSDDPQQTESMDFSVLRNDNNNNNEQNLKRTLSTGDVSFISESPFDLTESERYRIRNRYQNPIGQIHTVEEKHQRLNTMFGIRPFQPSVMNKPLEDHSKTVQELYAEPKNVPQQGKKQKKNKKKFTKT